MTDDQHKRVDRIARMICEITGGLNVAIDLLPDRGPVCDMLAGMLRIAELAAGEVDILESAPAIPA